MGRITANTHSSGKAHPEFKTTYEINLNKILNTFTYHAQY